MKAVLDIDRNKSSNIILSSGHNTKYPNFLIYLYTCTIYTYVQKKIKD